MTDGSTLDALLVARGECDARTVERAQRVAAETGQKLDHVLLQLGLVNEQVLAGAHAALLDQPLLTAQDLASVHQPVLPERLRSRFVHHAHVLPFAVQDQTLLLAMADPQDQFTRRAIEVATRLTVQPLAAVRQELETALNRLYPEGAEAATLRHAETEDSTEGDADRLKDMASEAPIIRLVNQMIFRAVETRASDIHVEPFQDALRVRYRYDGILHETEVQPARLSPAIVSRIKIMAKLDIAERRLPQDGRIKLAVRGNDVDFRVSTVPTLYGESVVLRVLDRSTVRFDYDQLSFSRTVTQQVQKALEQPNGIMLVTGPTGSGKTTTLYTGLNGINTEARKIVTIEDPVEYQMAGINQLQVKPQIGLNFTKLLRAILRQDPDVIMVGEIRDLETAQIAVQAALTGHLVLSTLHTNSAAAAVTRLRDMGLEDYLLSAVLRGVLGQRLVRRVCSVCRTPAPDSDEMIARFGLSPEPGQHFWHAQGCPACRHTGYRGRKSIAEFLAPSDEINRLILRGAAQHEIEACAREDGMVPMFFVGLQAALDGETTVAEVLRCLCAEG